MPKINILSPFVADLIAAGEVVERPASVVKELIENSVDAGARNITVEIRSGGAEYIRVTDDGCGMAPEDAGVAFLRHATSKLNDERGLEAIGTLGFRGEALAAIGSVARLELMTREKGADSGTRVLLEGGDILEMGECGCPEGTTMIVRGLFYNTPARLKFMKPDRSEGASCAAAALRCALSHPELSVRCLRDDKEVFFTPGDGRAESCIYSLLGRDAAGAMLPVSVDDGGVKVSGFVSSPSAGQGSRAKQYFFCNGRHIRSQLLQAAVERAYKNTLLSGRFPACVIYITLSFGAVDVNVHPAKTEVKFSDEKRVFDAVYYAVLGALEAETAVPVTRAEDYAPAPVSAPKIVSAPEPKSSFFFGEPSFHYQTRMDIPRSSFDPPDAGRHFSPPQPKSEPHYSTSTPGTASAIPAEPDVWEAKTEDMPVRVIGESLGLYIIVERGGSLILIDKHAAHERIIFDTLQKNGFEAMSQSLLAPMTFNVSDGDAELLSDNAALFSGLGFETEPFGGNAFILRAAPCGIDPFDAVAAVEEILASLKTSLRPDPLAARDEALKTISCKAAIKAGQRSEPAELQKLAEAVCSGEIRYCPHGRPVSWTITRAELDRQFKRII
ncbi:MAG: DNA mismatch repair endonuclease MutL [Clostridia bacterium]|nr:DNA mismatch repair endonuclease MutL [Clostridia bacterium]